MTSESPMSRGRLVGQIAGHLLFWGWNLLLVSLVLFGFGPVLLPEMLVATWYGLVPVELLVFAFAVVGVPVLGLLLAALTSLRSDAGRLLSLFYGVQVPVMLVLLVRLFAIHELVAATGFALAVVGVGAVALLRTLLHGPEERSSVLQGLRLISASAYLLVGLWWAASTALLLIPWSAWMVFRVLELPFHVSWEPWSLISAVEALPFLIFFLLTAAMFLVMPFAALGITARNWQLVARAARGRFGPAALGLSGVTWAVTAGVFGWLAQQPQAAAIERIQSVRTDDERRALMEDREALRDGLLTARIGGDRYLEGDGQVVEDAWKEFLGNLALMPRAVWNGLMSPITYQAVSDEQVFTSGRTWSPLPMDVKIATELYAEVFDTPMAVGEREALVRSATYTWSWRDAAAGLLDVGEQRVRLARQEVDVAPHGDLATVSIHDVWRNQTFDRQEIRLSFSLPPTAALTGVWLGHTDDRDEAFAYIVAPRGAAQEVYESEVRARVDPALLEQVGPRQYRLRAFPVEGREGSVGDVWSIGEEGEDLHVFLEAVVPAVDGVFPLPELTEARNAYWNADTERTLQGRPVTVDDWLPASIPGAAALERHEAVVAGQHVVATPATPGPAARRRVDVVVDGSASMRAHAAEVESALGQLRATLDVTVFCVREQQLQKCDTSWTDPVWWGHRSPAEHLAEWAELDRDPDALVVLTDRAPMRCSAGRGRRRGSGWRRRPRWRTPCRTSSCPSSGWSTSAGSRRPTRTGRSTGSSDPGVGWSLT